MHRRATPCEHAPRLTPNGAVRFSIWLARLIMTVAGFVMCAEAW